MSGWETFTFQGRSATPKMTVRKGGQIGLNTAAVNRFGLEKYKYVALLINKEERKIGIKPTNDENTKGAKSFKIIQGGATIPAKNFVEFYGLNNVKERRMVCVWDNENRMIIAEYKI